MALLMPLALSACGFSVRGAPDIPPNMTAVYIDSQNRYSEFYASLVTKIRSTELKLTKTPAEADTIIRILRDETGQRTLSVSGRNVPNELELYYIIQFAIFIEGKEALAPTQLIRTRDYTFDETLVLGKAREEEGLRRAIADDLVGMVVQHIGAIN
jgi:LPS-assembly lipoprotein